MVFKLAWEKSSLQHEISKSSINKMIKSVLPNAAIKNYHIISGGCANLNIKIELKENKTPFILRIYLRDKNAVFQEQKISNLLKNTLPVPSIIHIGSNDNYQFAILEFMPGIPLRDLLLSDDKCDIQGIMYEVGYMLSVISKHNYPDSNSLPQESFLDFAKKSLTNTHVISELDPQKISEINYLFYKYKDFLPKTNSQLVHGDFDPANILVKKKNGSWKVSAILDWEFSFSGSTLYDVANMLRYAHHMPLEFSSAFIKGLQDNNFILPHNWLISTHILNIFSLLDFLQRPDLQNKPSQRSDIHQLINHILKELG
jgi:Ser/Thr protein kinase RdoA (MazF antagonist)